MTREEAIAYGNDYYIDLISACCKIDEKHKEFIKMSLKALEQEPCEDCISKETARRIVDSGRTRQQMIDMILATPPVMPTQRWIPVSEGLPEDTEPVNITWVNHNPESYYKDIKDKPFTAVGHYCKGKWYWYSSTCQDYLEEYGRSDVDEIDKDIEVTAWMPLPEPYKAESEVR